MRITRTKVAGLSQLVAATAVVFLAAACSSGVDATLNLINPCSEDLISKLGCQFIEVVISSPDPNDHLSPTQISSGYGPLRITCPANSGKCQISTSDLLSPTSERIVDAQCLPTEGGTPVGRATSSSLLFSTGSGGVGGANLNLLMGRVNGLVETTDLEMGKNIGTCSGLQQQGGRYGAAAALLHDGRVLITGGIRHMSQQGVEDILTSAEIFDPGTGVHKLLIGPDGTPLTMKSPSGRAYHTATTLRDGRVLLAGGIGMNQQNGSMVKTSLQHSELYDPDTNTFSAISVMGSGRAHHAATMLSTGEVLLTGGATYLNGDLSTFYNNGLLYNPSDNNWRPVGNNMGAGRAFHQAVLLDTTATGGKVVIIGGENENGPTNSIDIFNPSVDQFMSGITLTMAKNRSHLCAVKVNNGSVLVAGGITDKPVQGQPLAVDNAIEVYDPLNGATGSFSSQGNLQVARMDQTCSLLDTGNVLVAGGLTGSGQATGIVEEAMVGSGTITVQQVPDQLNPPRYLHTATVLLNGWVFIEGGLPSSDPAAQAISQSILFVPPPSF